MVADVAPAVNINVVILHGPHESGTLGIRVGGAVNLGNENRE